MIEDVKKAEKEKKNWRSINSQSQPRNIKVSYKYSSVRKKSSLRKYSSVFHWTRDIIFLPFYSELTSFVAIIKPSHAAETFHCLLSQHDMSLLYDAFNQDIKNVLAQISSALLHHSTSPLWKPLTPVQQGLFTPVLHTNSVTHMTYMYT